MVARRKANRLQHAAAYCNALQHTATHVMVVRRRAHRLENEGLVSKGWFAEKLDCFADMFGRKNMNKREESTCMCTSIQFV